MEWVNVVFWVAGTLVTVLAPMILIHELGHFIAAKLAGVRVEEFGIGFPPRLAGLWRGEGSLTIGSTTIAIRRGFRLPHAVVAGTHVDAAVERKEDGSLELRRIEIADMSAPAGSGLSAAPGRESLRGKITELDKGTLYSLNWLPLGGFVRMTGEEDPSDGRSLAAQPKRWRLVVLAAGALLNIAVALLLIATAYGAGSPQQWVVQIGAVSPDSAAEEAGLLPEDVVLAVDGESVGGEGMGDGQDALRAAILASPEQEIVLTILRGGEPMTLSATPRTDEEYGVLLGISMMAWPDPTSVRRYSFGEAVSAGLADFVDVVLAMVRLPGQVLSGEVSPQVARPSSVVGISGILAFQLQRSIEWKLAFPVLQMAAFVSLGLAAANLLPLPALDGGRIAFVILEALRGRRVEPEREAMVHTVGLMILVTLLVFVFFVEILLPILPWSWLE